MRFASLFGRFAVGALLLLPATALADAVEVHGSTTLTNAVLAPYKAEIESWAGVEIKVRPSNSGQGLADLVGGLADIAMISAPLADVAAREQTTLGWPVDTRQLNTHLVGHAWVQFIINQTNPIGRLPGKTIAALITGRITNWHQVGGPDLPVILVAEQPSGAMRTEIVDKLLKGADFPAETTPMRYAPQAATLVADLPGALGFISSATPHVKTAGIAVLRSDADIRQDLIIVIKTSADDRVRRVYDAIAHVAERHTAG